MTYKLFEHDRVKKFFKKHKKDKKLLLRITKYYEILDDPYNAEFIELTRSGINWFVVFLCKLHFYQFH